MPRVTGVARWRGGARGALAALASPVALRRARLGALLAPASERGERSDSGELAVALAVATRTLGLLDRAAGWLPVARRPWRNSCLFRSVAQCVVLRAYGRAARVALGAGRVDEAVGAHAWVMYDGPEPVERPAADFVTFRPSAPARR